MLTLRFHTADNNEFARTISEVVPRVGEFIWLKQTPNWGKPFAENYRVIEVAYVVPDHNGGYQTPISSVVIYVEPVYGARTRKE